MSSENDIEALRGALILARSQLKTLGGDSTHLSEDDAFSEGYDMIQHRILMLIDAVLKETGK